MKNSLKGLNRRFVLSEERICDCENGSVEMILSKEEKSKRMKENEQSLRDLWDTTKCVNIHIKGAPKGKKKE